MGVLYMKFNKVSQALEYFEHAVRTLENINQNSSPKTYRLNNSSYHTKQNFGLELYSNYAVALRKLRKFGAAIYWQNKCLSIKPQDADTHASIGFTYHLAAEFDLAVKHYHKALSIQPNLAFCTNMLTRAMEDMNRNCR